MSFQIKKTVTGPNAAANASCALDLDSDDVPEQFNCPVCMEVPMEEIFQCPNGHTVCKACCKDLCAQCRSPMKFPGKPGTGSSEDFCMRNRALEHLLDSMLIACPFKKNGCLESILGRATLKAHKEKCNYDGNCIQLCRHLGFKNCEYWARATKPLEVSGHFCGIHEGILHDGTTMSIAFLNASKFLTTVSVEHASPSPHMLWVPTHMKAFNGHFLVVNLFCEADCTLSFVGLRIDKHPEGEQIKTEFEVKINSKNAEMPDLVWKMPAISILKAAAVLKHLPLRVPATALKYCYLEDNDFLKIHITVSRQKNSVKRKAPEN